MPSPDLQRRSLPRNFSGLPETRSPPPFPSRTRRRPRHCVGALSGSFQRREVGQAQVAGSTNASKPVDAVAPPRLQRLPAHDPLSGRGERHRRFGEFQKQLLPLDARRSGAKPRSSSTATKKWSSSPRCRHRWRRRYARPRTAPRRRSVRRQGRGGISAKQPVTPRPSAIRPRTALKTSAAGAPVGRGREARPAPPGHQRPGYRGGSGRCWDA